jgi:ubiquinone biosynthesis protein Coq4
MDASETAAFERACTEPLGAQAIRALAARAQASAERADCLALVAALAHCAFAAPERVAMTYDAAARGWLGASVDGPVIDAADLPRLPIPPALWSALGELRRDAATGLLGAGEVTTRTAALGAHHDPALRERAAASAPAWPGVTQAAAGQAPARWALADLAAAPADSLSARFRRLVVDNGFDLEVLDCEAMDLASLPPPLGWLNARILQVHDLWHIVAGYQTAGLHEVAISAFQLAQFGHGYSAMFLASTALGAADRAPERFGLTMDVVFSACKHGRETPPMIAIPWEAVWGETVEAVRARFRITPYASPYPSDVFERGIAV